MKQMKNHLRLRFKEIGFSLLFMEVALTQSSSNHCFFEVFVMDPEALFSLPLYLKQYFEDTSQWYLNII